MTAISSPPVRTPMQLPAGGDTPALLSPAARALNSGRAVPEWIGKTPDTKVPPHVRMRIFLAHDGRCYLTGRKIRPADYWELEHKVALCNGGLHREANLAPALRDAHRIKTRADVAEKAKVDRLRKRHMGIKKPRTMRVWRKFNQEVVRAERER